MRDGPTPALWPSLSKGRDRPGRAVARRRVELRSDPPGYGSGCADAAGCCGFARRAHASSRRWRELHAFAYEFSEAGVAAAIDDRGPVFIGGDGREIARAFRYDNGPDYFTEGRARVVVSGRVGSSCRRRRP